METRPILTGRRHTSIPGTSLRAIGVATAVTMEAAGDTEIAVTEVAVTAVAGIRDIATATVATAADILTGATEPPVADMETTVTAAASTPPAAMAESVPHTSSLVSRRRIS